MLRNLLVVLLVCVGQAALAQGIYSWKDASGRVHYSDLPPPEVTVRTVRQAASAPSRAAAPDSTQAAPQSYAEKDLAFRKRRAEAAETEEKSRKNKAAEDARERDCTEMRRQLAALETARASAASTTPASAPFSTRTNATPRSNAPAKPWSAPANSKSSRRPRANPWQNYAAPSSADPPPFFMTFPSSARLRRTSFGSAISGR